MRSAVVVTSFAVLLAVAGCSKRRSHTELVQDIATWSALPDDDAMVAAAGPIVSRWQGQRVRWSALANAVMCVEPPASAAGLGAAAQTTTTCAMNPFPRGGDDAAAAAALGGMYPLYRLDAAAVAALHEHCRGLSTCVVDVEATLRSLTLDPEQALAVAFDDVKVHGGRAVAADEPWMQRRAPVVPVAPGKPALKFDPADALVPSVRVAAKVF